MSTITFDTLRFVKTLEAGGINPEQAEAIAEAYRDASADQQLVTKVDLELALQKELAPMKTEQQVAKWMNGLMLGGIVTLILKSFYIA